MIVAWGGVSLVRLCLPERVLPIRRVRGWVGAEPKRPRVATSVDRRTAPSLPNVTSPRLLLAHPAGDPEPLLRSSIRMACKGRFAGLPTPTAASQLSPYLQRCKGKRAFLFGICPGQEPVASHRETSRRGVKPRTRRHAWPWASAGAKAHWGKRGCGLPGGGTEASRFFDENQMSKYKANSWGWGRNRMGSTSRDRL